MPTFGTSASREEYLEARKRGLVRINHHTRSLNMLLTYIPRVVQRIGRNYYTEPWARMLAESEPISDKAREWAFKKVATDPDFMLAIDSFMRLSKNAGPYVSEEVQLSEAIEGQVADYRRFAEFIVNMWVETED